MKVNFTLSIATVFLLTISIFGADNLYGQAEKQWPYPFPCRIEDGANIDVLLMTLGDVKTNLTTGIFDPSKDEVLLENGTVVPNYYKDVRGIKFYSPIDKSRFKLPPSGWCSWYYYYQELDEVEIMKNAKWMSENLKDYGATLVQLDDGWQGVGRGNATNRDWTTIDKRFPSGMGHLASYIKSCGMTPGIWLAPHGQSNPDIVKANPNVFLLKKDGTSASDTWEGKFLVDPSTKQSDRYMKNLFSTLAGWGYEYFKIDGQPIVVREYRTKREFMKKPVGTHEELYRRTLMNIRAGIGPDNYLLGCWVVPLEGMGIMNGSRTSGDVILEWKGFKTALRSTMEYYFLHNVAWYCDPDVMLVRSPLPMDQARVWATLQGLTGQALMTSDRMMDLPEDRIEIAKRVYPAVNIRPVDLFPYAINKRIWDLKINHLDRQYDVVGVFNYNDERAESVYISWEDLDLPIDKPIHVFDFWDKEYLGAWDKGISFNLPPASCKALSLFPDDGNIQLVSTSRHITQGWVDLKAANYDKQIASYSGTSVVVNNDPYELRFAFPRGTNFIVKSAFAKNGSSSLPVKISNYQGWAVVQFTSPINEEVDWEVVFEPSNYHHRPVEAPDNLGVEIAGFNGVVLSWNPRMQSAAGYQVHLNGKNLGFTSSSLFPLNHLHPDSTYVAEVRTVWSDGKQSDKPVRHEFKIANLIGKEIYLSELRPVSEGFGWRLPAFNKTILGKGMVLGGKPYPNGIGVPTGSDVSFDLDKYFQRFTSVVGIDDGNNREGAAEFILIGDGRELWKSGVLKRSDAPLLVDVDISGIKKLTLKVDRKDGGASGDQTNWADAKVTK